MGAEGSEEDSTPTIRRVGAKAIFEGVLVASRYLIVVPVVVLVAAAGGAFAYGTDLFILEFLHVASASLPVGHKIGEILVVIDLFLIGATLLLASIGLYELFVGRISTPRGAHLPAWLQMRDLNDLKSRIIAMIVLIMSVEFVQVLVDSTAGLAIAEHGAGVAVVIAALTAFLRLAGSSHDER